MTKNNSIFDVIIIGGGPAGMMAAISAASEEELKEGRKRDKKKIILVEKNSHLGKKLLLTGGGRCNLTNNCDIDSLNENFPKNSKFLFSAFSEMNNVDIMNWFESHGVSLKVEARGRVIPKSDKAASILEAMQYEMNRLGVEIIYNARVSEIMTLDKQDNQNSHNEQVKQLNGIVMEDGRKIFCRNIILATGGASFSKTGSSGDGHRLASQLGHTVTELYPAEVPMTSSDDYIEEGVLKGLSLKDVGLTLSNLKARVVYKTSGDIIFTHFGISGPAAIQCSSYLQKVWKKQEEKKAILSLDIFPEKSLGELETEWYAKSKAMQNKEVKTFLKEWMPIRYGEFLMEQLGIAVGELVKHLEHGKVRELLGAIKGFKIVVNGTLPLEQAFATDGGIKVKEINPSTMESKLVKGLFFAGEIIDVNGFTGGFNITAAISTGWLAGKSVSKI